MTFRPEDDLLDDEDEGDDLQDDTDPKGVSDGGKDPKASEKRIRDLQSERDKETARANKAEKQLKALLTSGSGSESGNPPSGNAADGAVLDMARMFAIQQHPKLGEYGLTASDLEGSTPGEVAQHAADLVARYEKVETQARNKVLAETGHAPEIDAGAPAPKNRDFSKMSKEDFEKVMAEALAKPPAS